MKVWRTIRYSALSLLLVVVVLVGGAAPASATVGDAGKYIVDQFWAFAKCQWGDVDTTPTYIYNVLTELLRSSLDKSPEEATAADWQNVYNQYTSNIQNTYNTTNIGMDGTSRLYLSGGWTYQTPYHSSTVLGTKSEYPYMLAKGGYNSGYYIVGADHMLSGIFTVPVSGNYRFVVPPPTVQGTASVNSKLSFPPGLQVYKGNDPGGLGGVSFFTASSAQGFIDNGTNFLSALQAGTQYQLKLSFHMFVPSNSIAYSFAFPCPYLEGVQLFPSGSDIIKSDTRIGTNSGNFGYYGDGGQLIAAEDVTIINETNNTYTNPQTGETTPITNWSYDYGDRSYNLTLQGDLSAKVVFGDENVTIKEGDTVYNIYYLVSNPTPEPTPTPEPSGNPQPTPTPSGDPQPSPSVNPDDPGGGGGSIWDKIVDLILGFLKLLGEVIGGLIAGILSFFTGILSNVTKLLDLFGNFGDLMANLFTWLPPEMQALISGAFAILLALAVIKLFLNK